MVFSQGNVIDTQHSRTTLFTFVGQRAQQVKLRIGAVGYAGFARPASATLASGLERERGQQVSRFVRPSGVMSQHALEPLDEYFTWAIWYIAQPPAAVDTRTHGVAAPGQVERPAKELLC